MKRARIVSTVDEDQQQMERETLHAVLYRYCLSLTNSSWDAEDLVQDTWVKGLRAAYHAGHANPEALLLRIAKNTWIDHLRRHHQYKLITQRMQDLKKTEDFEVLDCEEALYVILRRLSPLQRKVFFLRDVFEYSIAETAKRLETTEGAVKAALHRARTALIPAREELKSGAIQLPNEEDSKEWLRAISAAYQSGNVSLLLELAQRDIAEAPLCISIATTTKLKKASQPTRNTNLRDVFSMQFAA
ncbi:RNA polymerase sigma factor [Paenibacillus sinopodophylli]|uniref:RNA polymerase sigma factor n=1 Tax=Paenibacillus sinopodophylli TaxID=1837342 RepID=UPI00110CFDA3|nr:RNA polymerase sigma factor [Paenibacillus sinopodophylli]